MAKIISELKESIVKRMTSSHLAGPDVSDAVRIGNEAKLRGWSLTFGAWTRPVDTPRATLTSFLAALEAIRTNSLDCYLSIKAERLNYDFGLLTELLDCGANVKTRIHFDAMDPASPDPTFALLERALGTHKNLGCTLPSRWRRSLDDAQRVIDFGIPVRIVKGQWADPSGPVPDLRANFIKIISRLSGKAAHVAVATHDRPLAEKSLTCLKNSGTSCEMEQLSSLPQNCAGLAKSLSVPMRIYIPYGYPSLPYDIWQVRTRPEIMAWVMMDFLSGKHRRLSSAG